eukprot:651202-Pelagomonas_calceolata.AAC.1
MHFLGVKSTATNWAILKEGGREPLQFYGFRDTVKFFNSMLDLNCKTLRQVLKADLHLAARDDSCWSAHMFEAVSGMRNQDLSKRNAGCIGSYPS